MRWNAGYALCYYQSKRQTSLCCKYDGLINPGRRVKSHPQAETRWEGLFQVNERLVVISDVAKKRRMFWSHLPRSLENGASMFSGILSFLLSRASREGVYYFKKAWSSFYTIPSSMKKGIKLTHKEGSLKASHSTVPQLRRTSPVIQASKLP